MGAPFQGFSTDPNNDTITFTSCLGRRDEEGFLRRNVQCTVRNTPPLFPFLLSFQSVDTVHIVLQNLCPAQDHGKAQPAIQLADV